MAAVVASLAAAAVGVGPSVDTTHPFWLDDAEYQTYRSTEQIPQHSEHLVIGAGIAGMSTAYQLSTQHGAKVTVLDARGVCGGASGRNSGGVGSGIDWAGTAAKYGEAFAARLLAHSAEEFAELVALNEAPDCRGCWVRAAGSASFFTSTKQFRAAKAEVERQQAAGHGGNLSVWDYDATAAASGSEFFVGATYSKYAGNVWAARFIFMLTRRALATGRLNLQTNTRVTRVAFDAGSKVWRVTTDGRGAVTATNIVFATNAYTRDLISEGAWITPVRGQIVMTHRVPRLWDFDAGTDLGDVYMHQQPTGEMLLGGMRRLTKDGQANTTDDSNVDPVVHGALVGLVPEFFPAAQGAGEWRSWSGIMGFSKDGKPLVGPLPGRTGAYIVAGFTGGGIQAGFRFGRALADIIATGSPPAYWKELAPYYDQYLASRLK